MAMDPSSTNFVDAFDHWAKVHPERCAVVDAAGQFTWLQLQATSLAVGSHVQQMVQAEAVEVAGIYSKRSCLWLAATLALTRLRVVFVWMGCELAKGREKELQQNEAVLWSLQPQLLLLGQELPQQLQPQHRCRQLVLEKAQVPVAGYPLVRPGATGGSRDGLLCFQLTGGTTGASKCVEVRQHMALHELAAYPKAFPKLSCEDRVLQHTPVLWAASAIGQINIAASCGATLCIAEELDQASISKFGATVLGVVPSALEALQPLEVPTVRWIFTWGEAMSGAVAQRWCSDARRVVELLISTEYWLSLYSEGRNARSGRSIYVAVPGAEVAVSREGQLYKDGTGELCLRGPMVTSGYRGAPTSFVEAADGGGAFFKTCDTVTLLGSQPESLEFKGRSDMLIKVAGQFHYLNDIEDRLREALLPPPENTDSAVVQEVAVLPPSSNSTNEAPAHVFISVLGEGRRASAARLLERAKAVAPHAAALHFLGKALPKDPVSTKVDRRSLLQGVATSADSSTPRTSLWPAMRARLGPQPVWLLPMLLVGALNLTSWLKTGRASRPSVKNLIQLLLHVAAVPYLWLLSLHVPIHLCRSCINYVPFGRVGLLGIWYHMARSSGPKAWFARLSLAASTWLGAATLRREALLPWWIVFWLAIPDQLQAECGWWLKTDGWKWYFDEVSAAIFDARSRSIALADNIIEALGSAPETIREFLQRRRELQLPYQPPEELRPRPAPAPQETVRSTASQGEASAGATPVLPAVSTPLEFRPVAQECDAAPSSPGREATPEEPQREVVPDPEVVEEAPAREVAEEAAPEPEVVEDAALAPEVVEEVAPAPEVVEVSEASPMAVPEPAVAWSCVECRVPLPWGSDWRQEAEDFYCKQCHRNFDDRWWDFHTRDVIAFDEHGDSGSTDGGVVAVGAPGPAPAPPVQLETRTAAGQVVVRLLAQRMPQLTSETRLSGLDSLAVLTLCRQLRLALPGRECLKPQDFFRCSSVAELLQLVDQQPEELRDAPPEATGDVGVARTVWFAPGQVNSTCKWLYGCRGLLDPQCFRRAAARLLARHEGLRGEMESPAGMELLRFLRDTGPLHAMLWQHLDLAMEGWWLSPVVRRCRQLISWSLKESWPKSIPVRLTQEFLDERIQVVRCRSWREVEQASNQLRNNWRAPIAIGLFLLETAPEGDAGAERPEDWGAPSSFLQFVVSHAYSDGFCSVPMVQDFAALYAQEEEIASQSSLAQSSEGSRAGRLLPLQPGAAFKVLEQRFVAGLEGRPPWSHPDQLSMRSCTLDSAVPAKWTPWVYNHEVLVESEAVAHLRRCAKTYKIPFDVVLLGTVLAACFKASWQLQRTRHFYKGGTDEDFELKTTKMTMPLTFYAPMRDGDLNDAMVGLFSDWRDLTVPCSNLVSLLGFCLDLAELIRHRRWTVFDPVNNAQNILVNILPLDEEVRGEHFLQTRAHEYGGRRGSQADRRRCYKAAHRPMRLTLEQEAPDAWWISLDLNADHYPTAWCRAFAKSLAQTMKDLKSRPMLPVLRADWASIASPTARSEALDTSGAEN